MNSKFKIILSTLIFVLFIGAAYFAYNKLSDNYKPNIEQKLTENSNEQKTTENNSEQEKTKNPAYDFTVLDTNEKKVKLSDFFGKPIVLNFWASWCPPCKSEMPHFDKVYQAVKDDVIFLMVDMTDGQRETADKGKKYIKENGYSFPVYFDIEQEAAYVYRISSIPSTLFIDKEGNIVKGYQGAIDEKTLIEAINLIKE